MSITYSIKQYLRDIYSQVPKFTITASEPSTWNQTANQNPAVKPRQVEVTFCAMSNIMASVLFILCVGALLVDNTERILWQRIRASSRTHPCVRHVNCYTFCHSFIPQPMKDKFTVLFTCKNSFCDCRLFVDGTPKEIYISRWILSSCNPAFLLNQITKNEFLFAFIMISMKFAGMWTYQKLVSMLNFEANNLEFLAKKKAVSSSSAAWKLILWTQCRHDMCCIPSKQWKLW